MNEGIQPRPGIDVAEEELPEQDEEESAAASLDDDEELQKSVISKIKAMNEKAKPNRMAEVQNARDQRLYFRDIQQFSWNEDDQDVDFLDSESDPYSRTFNIFQGYGKIFCSTFMGAQPKVRAEADDPFDEVSIRNTGKANVYERVYRKFNDTPTQQLEFARLAWTDGRIITRTTQRENREITEFWGTLESRVPIAAKVDIETPLKNCALVELEDEYSKSSMKREYEDARSKISSGAGDSYERNARMAVKRMAGSDTTYESRSGDDSYGMATKTWSYMRPEFFEEFDEADRVTLKEKFPEGLCVVRNGDTYLESYACDMDSCLDVIHALPGDGMSRPSIGKTTMALQDSANTAQNLCEETFDHGIPTTYYDTRSDIDGLNKTREMPGASRKATGAQNQPLSNMFFQTQALTPSAALMEYMAQVKGPQAQFVSGQQPALFGADMADQKTASGYAQARAMALGQMAIVWKPYTAWYARENTRAVKMASKGDDDIKATLPPIRKGGKPEAVKLMPSDLMSVSFTNASDENFPQTWTEKSNKLLSLLQMGGDVSDWILEEEPDNIYFVKEMLGLEELVYPGEDLRNNVLADIASMEHEAPGPDPAQMPEQAMPGVGQPPAQVPEVSSITIDPEYLEENDFEVGWKTVKHWIQSARGQEAKVSNPTWFKNVKLYGLQYKAGMDAAKQAAAQAQQPPPEPPKPLLSLSGAYKDLPPDVQTQALQRDGYQVNPATVGVNANVGA